MGTTPDHRRADAVADSSLGHLPRMNLIYHHVGMFQILRRVCY